MARREAAAVVPKPNTGSNVKVAKLQIFNRKAVKVLGFLTVCKLFIKIRVRDVIVREQIQWMLSYVQGSVDIWKENILKDLKEGSLEYEMIGKFLVDLKKEFGSRNDETIKVVELKKIEQRNRTIKKFVQEFRKVVRENSYEGRLLIKEFK